MGNFESLGLVLSAVKDSHCLGLKKTNGTWFIMPPPRRGAGALSSDRVCRPSVCVMSRTSALTRKPKGLGRRIRGTPGHMRLPHRRQAQKVKSQGHGVKTNRARTLKFGTLAGICRYSGFM